MGTSASEEIALRVTTTADLAGTNAARASVGALAREAKAAGSTIAAAAAQGAHGQETLAKATQETTTQQVKMTVSADVMRDLTAKAGGDFEKLKTLLRAYVDEQENATRATDEESGAEERSQDALQRKGMAMARLRDQANRMNDAYDRQNGIVDRIPGKARTAANALTSMATAAATGQGSAHSLALAAGAAADGIATLSTSAKVAASAAGIGAVVTILATAIIALKQYNTEAKATELSLGRVKGASVADIDRIIGDQQARTEAARANYDRLVAERGLRGSVGPWSPQGKALRDYQAQLDALNHMEAARRDLLLQQRVHIQEETRQHALELADVGRTAVLEKLRLDSLEKATGFAQTAARAKELEKVTIQSETVLSQRALDIEGKRNEQQIRESFRQVDSLGRVIGLTMTQQEQLQLLLFVNRALTAVKKEQLEAEEKIARRTAANALRTEGAEYRMRRGEAYEARLEQIELERRAELAKTGDIVAANERADLRIRQLRRQTLKDVISDLGAIATATLESHSRTVRALGHGADTLRKVMIGAQAAHAAVEAAIEWGKSIGSLASGDLRGAGLHAASAAQLTAAAALGAREALGGGGAGGAGGGVGPSTSSRDPREAQNNVTVIIQTVNPFSREVIGETSYQLKRAGTLKTPIYAPPTSGAFAA